MQSSILITVPFYHTGPAKHVRMYLRYNQYSPPVSTIFYNKEIGNRFSTVIQHVLHHPRSCGNSSSVTSLW